MNFDPYSFLSRSVSVISIFYLAVIHITEVLTMVEKTYGLDLLKYEM